MEITKVHGIAFSTMLLLGMFSAASCLEGGLPIAKHKTIKNSKGDGKKSVVVINAKLFAVLRFVRLL